MDELLARLRAAGGRRPADERPTVVTAHFCIDLAAKRVTDSDGDEIRLTPTEWHRRGARAQPGQAGEPAPAAPRRCRARPTTGDQLPAGHLAPIRRKLEPDPSRPRYFVTEAGMGYRFEP